MLSLQDLNLVFPEGVVDTPATENFLLVLIIASLCVCVSDKCHIVIITVLIHYVPLWHAEPDKGDETSINITKLQGSFQNARNVICRQTKRLSVGRLRLVTCACYNMGSEC